MSANKSLSFEIIKTGLCPYLSNKYCVLNFLNIFGCNIGNKGLIELKSALISNKSLIYLNLGLNKLLKKEAAYAISEIIKNCHQLTEFDL